MPPLPLGRLTIEAVVERAGPTRPTWLLPDAVPEAFLQSIHNDKNRGGRRSHFDVDPESARKTRRALCERYAGGAVAVLGTHFHHPTAGRIVRHADTWRFEVL